MKTTEDKSAEASVTVTLADLLQQGDADGILAILKEDRSLLDVPLRGDLFPLHVAVKERHVRAVETLLSFKPDVNKVSNERGTREGYTALHYAADNNDATMIALLLSGGADVNQTNVEGWTPLHVACFKSKSDAVRALVEGGADVTLTTREGQPPLVFCVDHGQIGDVRFMLTHGAPANATADAENNSLLHYALHYNMAKMFNGAYELPDAQLDVSVALTVHGADPTVQNAGGDVCTRFIESQYPSLPQFLLAVHEGGAVFRDSPVVWNFMTFLSASVQQLVDAGVPPEKAKALHECTQMLEVERFNTEERRAAGRRPAPIAPALPPGDDPSGGKCPFFKNRGGAAAANLPQLPASHQGMSLEAMMQAGTSADPSGGRCPFLRNRAAGAAPSASTAPRAQCPFSIGYLLAHTNHLALLGVGFVLGVAVDRALLKSK